MRTGAEGAADRASVRQRVPAVPRWAALLSLHLLPPLTLACSQEGGSPLSPLIWAEGTALPRPQWACWCPGPLAAGTVPALGGPWDAAVDTIRVSELRPQMLRHVAPRLRAEKPLPFRLRPPRPGGRQRLLFPRPSTHLPTTDPQPSASCQRRPLPGEPQAGGAGWTQAEPGPRSQFRSPSEAAWGSACSRPGGKLYLKCHQVPRSLHPDPVGSSI